MHRSFLRQPDHHGISPDGKQNETQRGGVHYAALVPFCGRGKTFVTSAPTLIVVLFAGYLLGSIPFGIFMAKLFGGADIRRSVSGNIDATNDAHVRGARSVVVALLLGA